MKSARILPLLILTNLACGSVDPASNGATTGHGGNGGATGGGGSGGGGASGSTGAGGTSMTASTPQFVRADCGSISASTLQPVTSGTGATTFAVGQLVGGRVDPDSVANQTHRWAIQLAAGFYHLVMDGRTADGASTNLGLRIERQLAAGGKDVLFSGNEIARQYRDEAFFQVAAGELVTLQVTSVFAMADYRMAVFANGIPVPSPLFDKCPTVTPLVLGQPASFTLGAVGAATEEQWFLVDLPTGNYKFSVDAVQADGQDTNLIYQVDALDRFGEESRAKQVIRENKIGPHFTAEGMLSVGEHAAFWVRLRNGNKDLNMMLTATAQ